MFLQSSAKYETINPIDHQYREYYTKFGKSYGTKEEYELRQALFEQTQIELA
jgi:hypothetical protein